MQDLKGGQGLRSTHQIWTISPLHRQAGDIPAGILELGEQRHAEPFLILAINLEGVLLQNVKQIACRHVSEVLVLACDLQKRVLNIAAVVKGVGRANLFQDGQDGRGGSSHVGELRLRHLRPHFIAVQTPLSSQDISNPSP